LAFTVRRFESGGTRRDSPAGNGSKIQLGSNHIGFELVLAMIAVDQYSDGTYATHDLDVLIGQVVMSSQFSRMHRDANDKIESAYVSIDGNCRKRKRVRREETSSRWLDHLPQEQLWVA